MNVVDEGSAIEIQSEQTRKDKTMSFRVCKGIDVTIDSQWDSARGGKYNQVHVLHDPSGDTVVTSVTKLTKGTSKLLLT